MLVNEAETRVVGSLGWVDGPAIWSYDVDAGQAARVSVGEDGYLRVHGGDRDHFAVSHHRDAGGFSVSVRSLDHPDRELAGATVAGADVAMSGSPEAWSSVPRVYSGYQPRPPGDPGPADAAAYALLLIAPDGTTAEVQWLDWFSLASGYDLDYQGILDAVEVPDRGLVLIPIQRNSSPVIYDPDAREVVGHLALAGRAGNPTLRFRGDSLWADDYDTLLRLSPDDWSVRGKRRLQRSPGGTAQFIGDWAFARDGGICAVARPFSSDVVGLDTRKFRVTHRARCGRQPLQVAVLSNGRVLARDWKSGDLLEGGLHPTRRFFW
jgi:hypothetical protein